MAIAQIINPKTKEVINEYYIDDRLKSNLDKKIIPSLLKKDKDYVVCIDGKEGSGKSTLALQIGKYVDPSFDLSRIVFSPEDFREAILHAHKGQCIIYDEAFTGFSSRSSLSPVNRILVSLAMQMRQKNLFVIIVLPTIFLLDKYMALFRTRFLIHVYESKGNRGYFKIFNSKKKKFLILMGAKTMTYHVKGLYTRFKGRFYGKFALGGEEIEQRYRKKKEKSLADSENNSMNSKQVKFKEQRDLLLWLFKNYTGLTYQQIENIIIEYEFNMSFQQISKICAKFGNLSAEKVKEMSEKKQNTTKETISEEIDEISDDLEEKDE